MEKITIKNLLLWSSKKRDAVAEELSEKILADLKDFFEFSPEVVFQDSPLILPWEVDLEKLFEDMADTLRAEFMSDFVHHLGFDPDDWDGGNAWGCPWDMGCDPEGDTVKEMAKKWADENREEILKCMAEEKEMRKEEEEE